MKVTNRKLFKYLAAFACLGTLFWVGFGYFVRGALHMMTG